MVAHDLERPYKRPAVGMELGGGDVELGKELPFEAGERELELHLLESGRVDEAEGPVSAHLIIGTNGQIGGAR